MKKSAIFILFLLTTPAFAQEAFDEGKFQDGLNQWLSADLAAQLSALKSNNPIGSTIEIQAPEFGWGVYDADGKIVEIFGPSIPTKELTTGALAIPGYATPEGGVIKPIGADTYVATLTAASSGPESLLDTSVVKAIDAFGAATLYIARELCEQPARPSKLTLNPSADFKLVFGASTGTSAEWILAETCEQVASK